MLSKKTISLFLLVFLVGRTAIAQENLPSFSILDSGDPAPFSGYLLNPAAVAKVVTDREEDKKTLQAQCDAEKAKINLDIAKVREQKDAELAIKTNLVENITILKDSQIKERDKKIIDLQSQTTLDKFLIGGSFIAGIGLTVGILYLATGAR